MGTYIKTVAEVRSASGWEMNRAQVFANPIPDWDTVTKDRRAFVEYPFFLQSYAMMGFFADTRNYSESVVLAAPRGLP